MNNVTYEITEEILSFETGIQRSYGIVAYADTRETGTATVVASVRDITYDRQALSEFVDLCNSLELSVLHLNDAVEDFLAS